ncbi:hypothetical protein ACSS6W_008530 [Trichoderma asperelloides]|uniref:SnoaL-like domain-containing protein n=1 Tax=Trichoderma asperellum TaxID=101201 RepID=A0A6V8R3T4_TRIAP|nr:hypothetical protein LI328DRAFT_144284 [Trichoderma asperelloides]GFP58756.1 hypothetical protein TASIC1_0011012300 [Trichoderma asperellum]
MATSTTTLSLSAPISLSSLPALHPVLAFYAKYAKDFQDLANTAAEAYYTHDAYINLPHGASFTGRDRLWAFYKQLYGIFRANPIEQFYTLTVVSDAVGTHTLHMEYVRGLHSHDGSSVTRVPQVFVYEIGAATEGEGTDGLQIRGLRCYYDVSLMRAAAKAEGVEVKEFERA